MFNDPTIPPILQKESRGALRLKSEVEDILYDCYKDLSVFCKTFLPDVYRVEYTEQHKKFFSFVNDAYDEQRRRQAQGKLCGMKNIIIGARGLSKSNSLLLALPAREFLLGSCPFFIPISKSLDAVLPWSDALKRLLLSEDMREFVGYVKPNDEGMKEKFGAEFWIARMKKTGFEMAVWPLGRDQEIRGKNIKGRRPRLICLDDLEDREEVKNPDRREEVRKYIRTDVCKAVNQLEEENEPWGVWLSDTVKHFDAAVEHFSKQPDWNVLRVPICDENYQTLDPRYMSQASIDTEVEQARKGGTLHELAQELMARAGVNEEAPFKDSDFRFYTESSRKWNNEPSTNFIIVDPSRKKSMKSDDTGILAVRVNETESTIRFADAISDKMDMNDIIRRTLEQVVKHNAMYLGVEFAGLSSWGIQPFEDALKVNGLYHVTLIDLPPRQGKGSDLSGEDGAKIARLRPFAAYYSWHVVYHNSECKALAVLEEALKSFPNCPSWHLADCAGYVPYMMKKIGLSFQQLSFESEGEAREATGDATQYRRHRKRDDDNILDFARYQHDGPALSIEDPFEDGMDVGDLYAFTQ